MNAALQMKRSQSLPRSMQQAVAARSTPRLDDVAENESAPASPPSTPIAAVPPPKPVRHSRSMYTMAAQQQQRPRIVLPPMSRTVATQTDVMHMPRSQSACRVSE